MKRPDDEMRSYRFQLAEHRREIGDLDRLAARLRQERDKIELRQKAAEAGSAPVTFDKALIERRAHIEQSLAGIEAQLHQARAGLSEAYHGMRGSEIAASVRAERHRRRKAG
jgi:hypothetical protein